MTFIRRPLIKRQFDVAHDFQLSNLIVTGCSYTYNNSDSSACTWPYYLKDLGNFDQVLDCSMPGAGNFHISSTLQWALEVECPDPNDSLIIVMWSGHDRDDYISPIENVNDYPMQFYYTPTVCSGITGGAAPESKGNMNHAHLKNLSITKNQESRAIENYLIRSSLYNFLQNKGYTFVFFEYYDRTLPARTADFEIIPYLPDHLSERYNGMIYKITDLYRWSLGRNYLTDDLIHPNPDGHLSWTKSILLPTLIKILK